MDTISLDAVKDITFGRVGSMVSIEYGRNNQRFVSTIIRQLPTFSSQQNSFASSILVDRNRNESNRVYNENYDSKKYRY